MSLTDESSTNIQCSCVIVQGRQQEEMCSRASKVSNPENTTLSMSSTPNIEMGHGHGTGISDIFAYFDVYSHCLETKLKFLSLLACRVWPRRGRELEEKIVTFWQQTPSRVITQSREHGCRELSAHQPGEPLSRHLKTNILGRLHSN